MGLDMYAYSVAQGGAQDGEKIEIAYWRKHNRLHGWMEELWNRKGKPNESIGLEENLIHQSPASSEKSKDLLIQYNSFLEKIMEKISRV